MMCIFCKDLFERILVQTILHDTNIQILNVRKRRKLDLKEIKYLSNVCDETGSGELKGECDEMAQKCKL